MSLEWQKLGSSNLVSRLTSTSARMIDHPEADVFRVTWTLYISGNIWWYFGNDTEYRHCCSARLI